MNYASAILATLADAPHPLGHRDLMALLDPHGTDYAAYNDIGMALTRLHRAGLLDRERVQRDATQRRWYVYRIKDPSP